MPDAPAPAPAFLAAYRIASAAWHRKQASGTALRTARIERQTLVMLVAA